MQRAVTIGAALLLSAGAALAEGRITAATFDAPTTRYAHGVLGDAVEYGALTLTVQLAGQTQFITHTLPQDHVFEDLEPRLVDLDGDDQPEVIVVESDANAGAALAVYDVAGKRVETPHIGRTNRWLAPVAAADLDGDGWVEIAYIDRPHLAKTLRVWRYRDGALQEVASLKGLTNHRIGWDYILGGLRDCGAGFDLITADAAWRHVMATQLSPAGKLTSQQIARYDGPGSITQALACQDIAD